MSGQTFPETGVEVAPTTASELRDRIEAGESVTLLDSRRPADFEAWHIEGENVTTINVPFTEFLDGFDESLVEDVPKDEPVVVVCAVGRSSQFVAEVLSKHGYQTSNLADGMEGWARLYEAVDVSLEGDTLLRQYSRRSSGCLAYMVVSDGEAAVVDPLRAFVDRYRADAADLGVEITHVLDTHIHADHVSGLRELAAATGATAVMSAPAVDRGVTYADDLHVVADGEAIEVGEATLDVLGTPGHTTGMVTYVVDDQVALTGDTLFLDGVPRPDLEEGAEGAPDAADQLHATLHERIADLPEETLVGPAHVTPSTRPREDGAYLATLGDLFDRLDLLGLDRETFREAVLSDMPPRPSNYEAIIATNLGREAVDDETAFEIELGPNNCAAGG